MELKWSLGGVVFVALLVTRSNAQLDVCGVTQSNSRIVGGGDATAGAWPWHAVVRHHSAFHCSGSLINDQWILTSASCVSGIGLSLLSVQLGADCLDKPSANMVERSISRVIIHPSFRPSSLSNNIALLNMSSPVTFNNYIRPVCLAESGSVYEEGYTWVTGYGDTDTYSSNPYPRYLQEVEVPIVARSECQRAFWNPIPARIICAGGGRKGICDGDGGSPLVSKNTTMNRWVQAGLVAFQASNVGCGYPGVPEGYTRVSSYEDWIKSHIVTNPPGFILGAPRSAGTCLVSLPLLPLLPLLLLLSSVLSAVV